MCLPTELRLLYSFYCEKTNIDIADVIQSLDRCAEIILKNNCPTSETSHLKTMLKFFLNEIDNCAAIREFAISINQIALSDLKTRLAKDIDSASSIQAASELGLEGNLSYSKNKRSNYPKNVTTLLKSWLSSNYENPYPSEVIKQQICEITGLSMIQINNWFINARRRVLPNWNTNKVNSA